MIDSDTSRVRGGMLLARALAEKRIERVFTLCGGFINPVLEGLWKHGIEVINAPHEQIAGHMADAWTRIKGEAVVCLVGPEGFANAVPAMLEGFKYRSPIIFITGSSTLKRRGAGGFKEVDDIRVAAPLTKLSQLVTDGHRIPEQFDKAYTVAVTGEPGPVHLSIPVDLLYSSYATESAWGERPFDHAPKPRQICFPDMNALRVLAGRIERAQKPIMLVGRGATWANAKGEISEFAKRRQIPVLNAPYHPKVLDGDDGAYFGLADIHLYPPAHWALQQSDLIIIVGCRIDNMLNFGNPPFFPKNADVVAISASPEELVEAHSADHHLLGDPKVVFGKLLESLQSSSTRGGENWLQSNVEQRDLWVKRTLEDLRQAEGNEATKAGLHPLRLSLLIQEALGADDWLVIDGGDTHFWSEIALTLCRKRLRGILQPGPVSLLGVGSAFAATAKLIQPDSRVVLLSGDGAFLSGGFGIEVAFQENLPLTVVIDNNAGLGSITQQQRRLFGTAFKTQFRDIPFHELFRGLGGYGEMVSEPAGIKPALQRAALSGLPACINVKTYSVASPLVEALLDRRAKASIE